MGIPFPSHLQLGHMHPPHKDVVKVIFNGSEISLSAETSPYGQIKAGVLNLRGALERFNQQSFIKQFDFEDKLMPNRFRRQENRVYLDHHHSFVFKTHSKIFGPLRFSPYIIQKV
jgi:hypothetical protein